VTESVAEIRPMLLGDAEACERVWHESWTTLRRNLHLPEVSVTATMIDRMQARIRHLVRTDPAASYVAEESGQVVGVAQALVRDRVWVLSLFGVSPRTQARGIGRRLLDAVLDASDVRRGMILCSHDPRAMRLYTLGGFELHPSVVAVGHVEPDRLPPVPVSAGEAGDLTLVDEVDRQTRGASRRPDVEHLLAGGAQLLTHDDHRGYVVVGDNGPLLLAAGDEATASDLLVAALATAPSDDEAQVRWLTAHQQWAIETCLRAGLRLHPTGPVMLRGLPHLPGSYLASGAFG
jgi:GNAT superfamily N-acetyltransferase